MSRALYKKIGSYAEEDVQFLLKDLSSIQLEGAVDSREKRIQAGEHYSESLPIEYQPPKKYIELYDVALQKFKGMVAHYVAIVAEQIYKRNGVNTILVSLARAGTPIGILIKRYLKIKYKMEFPHYSISIIRGKGVDENAILYIKGKHPHGKIQFIDGWTGKGAISIELTKSCQLIQQQYGITLDDTLAVLADPGHCTNLFGTREDFLIPSALLNSTVSGLISRTVHNRRYMNEYDFHGAKYYKELADEDRSNEFLETITEQFKDNFEIEPVFRDEDITFSGLEDVKNIMRNYEINNIHLVKPGVGETTRVLLRRTPWKVLIKDMNNPYIEHIILLCQEKRIEMIPYPDMNYSACGLIRTVGKEQ